MSAAKAIDLIPNSKSKDIAWIAWYEVLPFMQKDNNMLFTEAWGLRGSIAANTNTLRGFMKDNGVVLSDDTLGIGWTKDVTLSAIGYVGSTLKVTQYIVIATTIGAVVLTGVLLYRLLTPEAVGIGLGVAAKVYTGKP